MSYYSKVSSDEYKSSQNTMCGYEEDIDKTMNDVYDKFQANQFMCYRNFEKNIDYHQGFFEDPAKSLCSIDIQKRGNNNIITNIKPSILPSGRVLWIDSKLEVPSCYPNTQ